MKHELMHDIFIRLEANKLEFEAITSFIYCQSI